MSGLLNADGGIAVDTNAFTVADGTGNTSVSGTLAIGSSGTAIVRHLSVTSSETIITSAIDTCTTATTSLSGVTEGDTVVLGLPDSLGSINGISWIGWVPSSGVVAVQACTANTTTTDPGAQTIRFDVWQH